MTNNEYSEDDFTIAPDFEDDQFDFDEEDDIDWAI